MGSSVMISKTPGNLEELISAAGTIQDATSFARFTQHMRMFLPGPEHQHRGVFSGQRVQDFQNWLLFENYKRRLSDAQLLAIMRAEFPQASGTVFTGNLSQGLTVVRAIRAHFNRDGHNGASPADKGLPPSESYGDF
jgi:hypothetical protein